MNGKVWLVGAGPGDAGLLTLRGREVLEGADVVVYDRLVGEGVLSLIPEAAERIDVGKRAGSHPVPQKEIEALLVERARSGRRVVRLKGGDPFLFGRGGEEAEALVRAGIPFEVVPGVSSALAVPAYAGIPATHRGLSSALRIITAHGKDGEHLDFDALARVKHETLVFLMGAENAGKLCRNLINAGMDIATPAAVVERGTTARQKCLTACLWDLPDLIREEGIAPPATLIVGRTAEMAERLDWRSFLPLSGLRVAVTRPRERAAPLCRMLRDGGAEVLESPCIAVEVLPRRLPLLGGADWIGFTSVTGVEALFTLLEREGRDVRELGGARIAAVGPATGKALRSRGLRVDFIPDPYDVEHLAAGLRALGGDILLFRAEGAAPLAGGGLREVPLYRVRPVKAVLPEDLDAVTLTSASTVQGVARNVPQGWEGYVRTWAVCLGEPTARAARRAGFARVTIAKRATLESLVEALARAVGAR